MIEDVLWCGGFELVVNVLWMVVEVVLGRISVEFAGTFYRAGSGWICLGVIKYVYWFDGDGYVIVIEMDVDVNMVWCVGKYVEMVRWMK